MKNYTRERSTMLGLAAIIAGGCVPHEDASIGRTDDTLTKLSVSACEEKGGVATPDPGDGSLLAEGCPDGDTLGVIHEEGWREGGLCCEKGDATDSDGYTVAECSAAGGVAMTDPGDGSLLANGCPDGGQTLGPIDEDGWIEGGLCCTGIMTAKYTVAECEAGGGKAVADPGDGSLLAQGCPDGAMTYGVIDEPSWREGGLCCSDPEAASDDTYSVAECEAAHGEAVTDPGDGSLIANGCPDGQTTLGTIDEEGWIEGGLCCRKDLPMLPDYGVTECEEQGGVARPDPGDGSLVTQGCPDGETTLGTIAEEGWTEGGLCCSKT